MSFVLFVIIIIIILMLQAVFREDMLRRDIEDLQKRYQVWHFYPVSTDFSIFMVSLVSFSHESLRCF